MPIHCRGCNYMTHGLPDVTLQSTRHEVILDGRWEVTSERQVVLRDPSIKSMGLIAQNGRKCIKSINYIINNC